LTEKYPKHQQLAGLAGELRGCALNLLLTVQRANEIQTIAPLKEIDVLKEQMIVMVRLSKDLKYISIPQYETASLSLVEIGKMNGGWMKAIRA